MGNSEVEKLYKKLKWYKVFIALLIILIPVVALLSHRRNIGPDSLYTKFPMLDPLREFVPEENYITNIQDLRIYLEGLGEKYPDSLSIYYENVNSGANISIHRDLHLFPASLTKLVQAILITKKVEDGVWAWSKELTALPTDLSSDSGTLYQSIGDRPVTVEKLIQELIVNSDNTAQNIFKHHLDVPDYVAFQAKTGLDDLYNDKGLVSAKDYTRVLRVLYTSSFLEPENSEKILEYMSEATFHEYLSQGIPAGIKFAHKFGENKVESIFADSGIVYVPGKPYMITVIIKGKDSKDTTRAWAVALMKEISEHAYEASK